MIKEIRPIHDDTMVVRKLVPDPPPKKIKQVPTVPQELPKQKEDEETEDDPLDFLKEDTKKTKRSK